MNGSPLVYNSRSVKCRPRKVFTSEIEGMPTEDATLMPVEYDHLRLGRSGRKLFGGSNCQNKDRLAVYRASSKPV